MTEGPAEQAIDIGQLEAGVAERCAPPRAWSCIAVLSGQMPIWSGLVDADKRNATMQRHQRHRWPV
jgi:hypothetical protein